MFPIPNNVGDGVLNDDNIYEPELSDQEIDVINADEELIPDDDEQFQNDEHAYREGVVYDDDDLDGYDEMDAETQRFMDNAFEPDAHPQYDGVLMSKDEYEAHYLNTNPDYLAEKQENALYNILENPNNIDSITKETRLSKCPEMQMLPCRRLRKTPKAVDSEKKLAEGAAKLKTQLVGVIPEVKDVRLVAKEKEKSTRTEIKPPALKIPIPVVVKSGTPYIGNPSLVATLTAKADAALEAKKKVKVRTRKMYKPPPIERPEKRQESSTFPLTPLPDRFFQKRHTITAEQAGFTSDCASCDSCKMMFRNVALLKTHLEKHRNGEKKVIRGMGLFCPMPKCIQRADTIATIVKHMKIAHHIHEIPFERVVFKDLDEFKMWRMELERLTMSRFSRASGKTNIFSKSTYYHCQHTGYVPSAMRTPEELRKARSRMSKKLGKTCTAFFHIRENDDKTVLLRGCTKHIGHGVDVRQLPISNDIKLEIACDLMKGYDESYIIDRMKLGTGNSNRRFYLQGYEIRNVANKIERFKKDFDNRIARGEIIPGLSEYFSKKLGRSKSASTRNPVSEEDVETVYDVTNIYPDSYFVEPVFTEEVVIEDGQFNIPSGMMEEVHFVPKKEVSPPPNENLDTGRVQQEKVVKVVKLSPDTVKETPQKRTRLDSGAGPSTSTPQPTRHSSRLLKKKTRPEIKTGNDGKDLQYRRSYQDSQLVGDDADYDVATE